MKSTQGFTWEELLIVFAILGILAAVVIPNVVGLLAKAEQYDSPEGTYYVIRHTGTGNCTEGTWIFNGKEYHWFCPKPTLAPTEKPN